MTEVKAFRARQEAFRKEAEVAMGRLNILTTGQPAGTWPPLPPGQPSLISRAATPRLGTLASTGTSAPRPHLLAAATSTGARLAFNQMSGIQTSAAATTTTTSATLETGSIPSTSQPFMAGQGQQQVQTFSTGYALFQVNGSSHVPPGFGSLYPGGANRVPNPYSYVGPNYMPTRPPTTLPTDGANPQPGVHPPPRLLNPRHSIC
jgi:hypothetical protein